MEISIITIFPGMFPGVFGDSILKRAQEKGLVHFNIVDLRDFTLDKHRSVDDYSYGGGPGMVMKPEPFFLAVESLQEKVYGEEEAHVILTSPQGNPFNHEKALELSQKKGLIILCGHYEGVDERVREHLVHEEISMGDYVLTGGEIPAMAMVDAVSRLIPGVLPREAVQEESFSQGLLEYPQYTRPEDFRGLKVPEVLLSGDHARIRKWREDQAYRRTVQKRPDLLE
jgi:tRNA (guanine37-N1)-methyltransferase